jgi:FkbM family methyltransferase
MIKTFLRSLVPEAWQVPVKYRINAWRGQLEPELEILEYVVQRGDRAIDIGGNRGIYTLALWREGATVEVFEPNPVCANVVSAWAAGKPAVTVHRVGLSDRAGTASLHIPVDEAGHEHDASASLGDHHIGRTREEVVTIEALDSFGFEDVAFVKIDVEGHEYNALRGAAQTLQSQLPAILVEIEQRHNARPITEVFDLVLGWGYEGYFLRGGKLVPIDRFDVERDQAMEHFDDDSSAYINNFLFLGKTKIALGRYAKLLKARS